MLNILMTKRVGCDVVGEQQSLQPRLLEILYQDSGIRRAWKDTLSNWLLDRYAAGQELDDLVLLDYLEAKHPEVFWRLKENPRIRDDIRDLVAKRG